jgi:uroporphyrinogen decarboxylase
MTLSSRRRVQLALSHHEPDRVPYDLGSIGPSGISLEAHAALLRYLGRSAPAELGDLGSQRAKLDEAFLREVGVDTRSVRCGAPRGWALQLREDADSISYHDEWGVGRKKARSGGHHFFVYDYPLADVPTQDLPHVPWPDPEDPQRLAGVREAIAELDRDGQPALVFGASFSQGLLQFAAQLEGHERFFTHLALEPFRAEWILEKLLELKLRFYRAVLPELDGRIDLVCESDDLGHQHSQWLSPAMFRTLVKPRYAQLFRALKAEFGVRILFHSCGAIYPFIGDIVEMGADALNPIQVGAAGMGDTARLKREFGDALCIWGGGVDVQRTLPFGTPQEVEDEVRRRIEDLAPGGGFVFAATQTIQPETPPQNVVAMWKALQRYGIHQGA